MKINYVLLLVPIVSFLTSCTTINKPQSDSKKLILKLQETDQELKESAVGLQKDWQNEKENYKNRFSDVLNNLRKHIDELYLTLDQGDAELRKEINRQLGDFHRLEEELNNIYTELVAATAVKIFNMFGETNKVIDNIKENFGAPPNP